MMDSLIYVGDISQSLRGPPTPWSPVRASRRRGDLSPITQLNNDPHSQHAELADTKYGVDVIIIISIILIRSFYVSREFIPN